MSREGDHITRGVRSVDGGTDKATNRDAQPHIKMGILRFVFFAGGGGISVEQTGGPSASDPSC